MKKIYFILLLTISTLAGKAQEIESSEKMQQDIDALKVAFISRELELTPDEAQAFWPLYNQYSKELKSTVKEDMDPLDRDEKVLNLRKRYREQFVKVLGNQRIKKMYGTENRFRQLLIKAMRNQKQNRVNRPNFRNGR